MIGYMLGNAFDRNQSPAALADWLATRKYVQVGADFTAAQRLFHLTMLLAPTLEDRHKRALLESALELLPHRSYRHRIRCRLAQLAARAGEGQAAYKWLEPCNLRPVDLREDTAFRLSVAYLATAAGAFDKVLMVLDALPDQLPFVDEHELEATLLRVNALERSGRAAEAMQQLRAALYQDVRNIAAARDLMTENRSLDLCRATYPLAHKEVWASVDTKLRPTDRARTHIWQVSLFGIWLTVGLSLVLGGAFGVWRNIGLVSKDGIYAFMVGSAWVGVLIPFILLFLTVRERRKKMELRQRGTLGFARVLKCQLRSVSEEGVRSYDLVVDVEVAGDLERVMTERIHKPVGLGIYPCLFDSDAPANVELAFE